MEDDDDDGSSIGSSIMYDASDGSDMAAIGDRVITASDGDRVTMDKTVNGYYEGPGISQLVVSQPRLSFTNGCSEELCFNTAGKKFYTLFYTEDANGGIELCETAVQVDTITKYLRILVDQQRDIELKIKHLFGLDSHAAVDQLTDSSLDACLETSIESHKRLMEMLEHHKAPRIIEDSSDMTCGGQFSEIESALTPRSHVNQMKQRLEIMQDNERELVGKLDHYKHLEDLYIRNIISHQNLTNVDLDVMNDLDRNETSPPPSSRSDKSVSSVTNASTLQAALDVFSENSKLLISKDNIEDQLKMVNVRNSELENKLAGLGKENEILRGETVRLKRELDEIKNSKDYSGDIGTQAESLNLEQLQKALVFERTSHQKCLQEKVDLEKHFVVINEERDALKAEKEALTNQCGDFLKQKATLQSKIEQLKSISHAKESGLKNVEQLQAKCEELNAQLSVYTEKFREMDCELANCKTNFRIKVDEVDHLRKIVSDKSDKAYKTECETVRQSLSKLEKELEKRKNDHTKLKDQYDSVSRALDSQNLGLKNIKDVLRLKDEALKEITEKHKLLDQEVKDLTGAKTELTSKLSLSEEAYKKQCDALTKLQNEFDEWKANAEKQYNDVCCDYDEQLSDLNTLLKKYVAYPGKHVSDSFSDRTFDRQIAETAIMTDPVQFYAGPLMELINYFYSPKEERCNNVGMTDSTRWAIENICLKFDLNKDQCEKIVNQLLDLYDSIRQKVTETQESLRIIGQREMALNEALYKNEILEKNMLADNDALAAAQFCYENNLKLLKAQLKVERNRVENLNAELEDQCNKTEQLEKLKEKLSAELDALKTYKEIAERTNQECLSVIKALQRQHNDDLAELKRANTELDAVRSRLSESKADRAVYVRLQECYAVLEKRSRLLEKDNCQLRAIRDKRDSLIEQKKYLCKIVESNNNHNEETLDFMRSRGFLPLKFIPGKRRSLKFKTFALLALAVARIRRRREKCRYLRCKYYTTAYLD